MWTPGASLCGFWAEPLKDRKKTDKKSYVSNFFYTSTQMWELPPAVRDELCHVKHPPHWLRWASSQYFKVSIPVQLPAMSDLISTGIPAWWRSMCWNSLSHTHTQTSRCSRKQRRLLFIWCAGVSTSPLQLLAYRGLLPLKGFWVYVLGIWHYTFVCSDSQKWFNSQFLARD